MTRPTTFTLNGSNSLYSGLLAAYLGNGVTSSSGPGNCPESVSGGTGAFSGYSSTPWLQDSTLGRWGLSYSGISGYITVPAITISGAFSASSWFKCSSYHLDIPVDFAGHGIAVGGLSGAGAGTGPYSGVISPDSNYSYHYSGSAPTLSAGTYYSLIATYDGSSTWTWYVNGSAYSCGSSNTYNSSLNANRIGWSNGGSACSLWDAMIWNRVLTAPEIAAVSSQSNSVLYTVGGSNLILPPATFNPSWAAANRQIGVR